VSNLDRWYMGAVIRDRFAQWWAGLAERRAGRRAELAAARADLPPTLVRARAIALVAVAVVSTAATVAALSESYRNLLMWAIHHGVPAPFSWVWPVTIDSFVILGELALFVALLDHWSGWAKAWPWLVIAAGLSASVAGNIGSLGAAPTWPSRLTAAASPAAAFVGLTIALAVLKRVVARARLTPAAADVRMEDIPVATRDIVSRLVSVGVRDTGQLAAVAGVTERHAARLRRAAEEARDSPAASPDMPRAAGRRNVSAPRLTPVGGQP
jgi:hypothetical protein